MTQRVPLPERLREQLNLPQASGLMRLSLEADAPADKAVLAGREVGASVRAGILRGGGVKEVEITLGERPARKR